MLYANVHLLLYFSQHLGLRSQLLLKTSTLSLQLLVRRSKPVRCRSTCVLACSTHAGWSRGTEASETGRRKMRSLLPDWTSRAAWNSWLRGVLTSLAWRRQPLVKRSAKKKSRSRKRRWVQLPNFSNVNSNVRLKSDFGGRHFETW